MPGQMLWFHPRSPLGSTRRAPLAPGDDLAAAGGDEVTVRAYASTVTAPGPGWQRSAGDARLRPRRSCHLPARGFRSAGQMPGTTGRAGWSRCSSPPKSSAMVLERWSMTDWRSWSGTWTWRWLNTCRCRPGLSAPVLVRRCPPPTASGSSSTGVARMARCRKRRLTRRGSGLVIITADVALQHGMIADHVVAEGSGIRAVRPVPARPERSRDHRPCPSGVRRHLRRLSPRPAAADRE